MKKLLILFALTLSQLTIGQDTWKATVLDAETKRPLPFVNVLIIMENNYPEPQRMWRVIFR